MAALTPAVGDSLPIAPGASALLAEGDRLIDACRFDEAMKVYERARKEYPDSEAGSYALLRHAETLARFSKFEHALAIERDLVAKNPGTLLACWAQFAIGKALVAKGDNTGSIGEMLKVKVMLPDRRDLEPLTDARRTLGRLCTDYVKGRTDILDAAQLLGLDCGDVRAKAEALAILAAYPGKNGRIDLANPILGRLERECPDEVDEIRWARTEVAVGYLKAQEDRKGEFAPLAAEILAKVRESAPANDDAAAKACVWLARYYDNNGKADDAVAVLREGKDKFAKTGHAAEIAYELGYALCRWGAQDEGVALLKRLIAEKPGSTWAYRAKFLVDKGTATARSPISLEALIKEAVAGYDAKWRYLAFSPSDELPDDPKLFAMQVVALAHEDQAEQAVPLMDRFAVRRSISADDLEKAKGEMVLASLTAAAECGRVSPDAMYVVTLLTRPTGDGKQQFTAPQARLLDSVIGVLRHAIRKGLSQAEVGVWHSWIGNTYVGMGRYREAILAFREVRESRDAANEAKAEATYRTALCYHAMKNYGSARRCMEEVVRRYPDDQWARKARGALYVWSTYGGSTELR